MKCIISILSLVLGLYTAVPTILAARILQPMEQSFFFDWDKTPELPIPVTEQCERIHITWGRQSATGPDPSAPYKLMVFTSGPWKTPFVIDAGVGLEFDWDVPFPPGTMYLICMFDNNGNSGGCQDRHTVIKNTTMASPSCQNITFPPVLGVQGYANTGPISDHGWIPQCSDIALQPVAGNSTPPFTVYIAPPLRTPYKIVSHDFSFINWTVTLSAGFAFFLSVESSDGLMWSVGPQHSSTSSSDGCLAPELLAANTSQPVPISTPESCTPELKSSRGAAAAAGAGVGGFFGGVFLALAGAYLYWRTRQKTLKNTLMIKPRPLSYPGPSSSHDQSDLSPLPLISPLASPPAAPTSPTTPALFRSVKNRNATRSLPDGGPSLPSRSRRPTVILHHDSGFRVVANPDPANPDMVELPPEYIERRTQPNST